MADSKRDGNFISVIAGVSSVDNSTYTLIEVNPVTGAVLLSFET